MIEGTRAHRAVRGQNRQTDVDLFLQPLAARSCIYTGRYQATIPLTITNPNPVTTGMAASVLKVRTKISCFV